MTDEPSRPGAGVPHDPDPVLRAAWGYFMEDMSQAQIAERLGVSRASVHNYLRQARESGLVRVTIDPASTARSALARRLAETYGLEAVYLVPDADGGGEGGSGAAMRAVARAAGTWLDDLLPEGAAVGVAWGETVHALAAQLPRRSRRDLTVVQVIGSMASPFGFNAEACTSLIADRLGAACVNLYAPAVVSSAAVAETLLAEPVIRDQIGRLDALDAAVFAIGLCDPTSHVVRAGVATVAELQSYREAGASAVVAGRFIDGDGRELAGPLDGRVIGIALDRLRAIPRRIVVSAGAERRASLRAALRGGFATHLVTDVALAASLVGED